MTAIVNTRNGIWRTADRLGQDESILQWPRMPDAKTVDKATRPKRMAQRYPASDSESCRAGMGPRTRQLLPNVAGWPEHRPARGFFTRKNLAQSSRRDHVTQNTAWSESQHHKAQSSPGVGRTVRVRRGRHHRQA